MLSFDKGTAAAVAREFLQVGKARPGKQHRVPGLTLVARNDDVMLRQMLRQACENTGGQKRHITEYDKGTIACGQAGYAECQRSSHAVFGARIFDSTNACDRLTWPDDGQTLVKIELLQVVEDVVNDGLATKIGAQLVATETAAAARRQYDYG